MSEHYRIKLVMGAHVTYPWDAWVYRPGDEHPAWTGYGATRADAEQVSREWIERDKAEKPEPEWIEVPA